MKYLFEKERTIFKRRKLLKFNRKSIIYKEVIKIMRFNLYGQYEKKTENFVFIPT